MGKSFTCNLLDPFSSLAHYEGEDDHSMSEDNHRTARMRMAWVRM